LVRETTHFYQLQIQEGEVIKSLRKELGEIDAHLRGEEGGPWLAEKGGRSRKKGGRRKNKGIEI